MAFQYSPKIITDGLVLALDAANPKSYPGSGTVWDNLVNRTTGSLQNGATFDSNNLGSIVFDGVNDYVFLGNNTEYQITGSLTLEAWIKCNSVSTVNQTIIGRDDAINRCYKIQTAYTIESKLQLVLSSNNTLYSWLASTSLNDNQWHHVVSTFLPSTSVVLYTDGVAETTSTSGIPAFIDNDPVDLEIGRRNRNGSELFLTGNVAICKIYNRALTAPEILQNYNLFKGRFGL